MSRRQVLGATLTAAVLTLGLVGLAGCGEKIAIPQAEGLFSNTGYLVDGVFDDAGARQISQSGGSLFVVTADSLVKRDQGYRQVAGIGGLVDATALCVGPNDEVLFVWDQGTHNLQWYAVADLEALGQAHLPAVHSVRALAANAQGIDQVPGARTYIYLADPDSAVVHRYAFDDFNGPTPYGILTRSEGEGARSVHEAAGMATDVDGMLLVCDTDTLRNWVIRFDATPDSVDTTPATGDQDPLRGSAVAFIANCEPPAAADIVLGDAAVCNQTDWVGGPSDVPGEFDRPTALAVDGSGRIFVADAGNDRIQFFSAVGDFGGLFGATVNCPAPTSLTLVDVRTGLGADQVNFGAFVYVVTPGTGQVRRFISREHYLYVYRERPPLP
jgi:DNA-binding beta-propeller fold protein YncE